MSMLLILLVSSIMMNSIYTVDASPAPIREPQPGDVGYETYQWCQSHKGCGGLDYDKDIREACEKLYAKKCNIRY